MNQIKELHPMDKIKLIDTGKCRIYAVWLPEMRTDVRLRFNRFLTYRQPFSSHIERLNEACEIVGISDRLTEEQWAEFFDEKLIPTVDNLGNSSVQIVSASKQGLSLLEASGITEKTLILRKL